ncbi:MAG TPA: DUF4331 family protein [Candidatus Cybelea sp.]|jgi:hypothetical protein
MSHHYSGPNLAFPNGDARLNFTDLYAFPKAGDATKTILIMDVHPSFGVNPPGPTTTVPFSTDALYEVMIDTNGDAIAELAYSVRFAASKTGEQSATVRRIEGTRTDRTGNDGVVILEGAPVSMGREASVTNAGDYIFFAGWRSDPFFFDAQGALNNLKFTGADFFADKNICSIVLEVPNSQLGSDKMHLWARTVDGSSGGWVQADRGARPSQEPFLAGDEHQAYITGQPAQDARFIPVFAHSLEHTGGYAREEAARVAAAQLPDVMPYQPALQVKYPTNGRALTDDVEVYFLSVLTNGKVTGDGLSPHTDLLAEFPYVGPPHNTSL